MADIRNKLIRIERYVRLYNKPWDDSDYVAEYLLAISIDELLIMFSAKPNDPFLYEGYELNERELSKLKKYSKGEVRIDFDHYNYVLECDGIYDWNQKR